MYSYSWLLYDMWSSQSNTDYTSNGKYKSKRNYAILNFSLFLERSTHPVSQPINMPNRTPDITSAYPDSHSAVFSPKSTDPANLGVNMCINILEGDNSPRVKDTTIKDVSQRLQTMKIYVSVAIQSSRFFMKVLVYVQCITDFLKL